MITEQSVLHRFEVPAHIDDSEKKVFDWARSYADEYMQEISNGNPGPKYEVVNYGSAMQGIDAVYYFCINKV